jgi:preprotein translocase subunit SecE
MAMNREQRRYLQRQGQMDSEGNPIATRRENRPAKTERVTPREYISEVRSEMNRVIWPTRSELINYTIVVVITFAFVTGLVAVLDYLFAEGFIALLQAGTEGSN